VGSPRDDGVDHGSQAGLEQRRHVGRSRHGGDGAAADAVVGDAGPQLGGPEPVRDLLVGAPHADQEPGDEEQDGPQGVTGGPALSSDLERTAFGDISIIEFVTIPLLIVLMGLFFRSVLTPVIPLGAVMIALGLSQAVVFVVGYYIASVDSQVTTMLFTILMGVGTDFPTAFAKAALAVGDRLPRKGTVFVSVADAEKDAVILMALILSTVGFRILATEGTHRSLRLNGIEAEAVLKHTEGEKLRAAARAAAQTGGDVEAGVVTIVDLIEAGAIDLVINVPRGRGARADGYEIRRAALRHGVPTMTNAAAAHAAVQAIAAASRDKEIGVTCLQDLHGQLAASAAERY